MIDQEKLRAFAEALKELVPANDRPRIVIQSPYPLGEHVYEAELVAAVGSRDKAKKLIRSGKIDGRVIGHSLVAKRASLVAFLDGPEVKPDMPSETPPREPTPEESAAAALKRSDLRIVRAK
jgi:hypothetical protein